MFGTIDNKPLAILGNPNTGKTNLMVYLAILNKYQKRYILGYPAQIEGFTNLNSLQDVAKIDHCVLCIDEIDEIIPFYENKQNASLKRLLKFAEHNKIKLIFTTQLSQFVNKMMEALVPQWAVTEIDIFSLKNGSKPKRILTRSLKLPQYINQEIGMRLEVGKFVWFNDYAEVGENGVYSFKNMNIGKDWSMTKSEKKEEIAEIQKKIQNEN